MTFGGGDQCFIDVGCVMMIYVNNIRNIIKEWYDIVCKSYSFIDNSKSINPNARSFRKHRNDQSIYSLLIKKYHISIKYHLGDWNTGCIRVLRTYGYKSQIDTKYKTLI